MAKIPIISGTFTPLPAGESNLLKVPSTDVDGVPATTKSLSRFDLRNISPASEIDLVRLSALEKFQSKSMSCLVSDIDVKNGENLNPPAPPTPKIVVDKIRRRSHEVGSKEADIEKKALAKKKLGHRRSHSAAMLLDAAGADVNVVDFMRQFNAAKNTEMRRSNDAIYATPAASSRPKSSTFPRSMSPVIVSAPPPAPHTPKLGKKLLKSMSVPMRHFLDVATQRYLPPASPPNRSFCGISASWMSLRVFIF